MHVIEWARRGEAVQELGLEGTHVVRASVQTPASAISALETIPCVTGQKFKSHMNCATNRAVWKAARVADAFLACPDFIAWEGAVRLDTMSQVLCRYSLKTDLYKANSRLIKVRNSSGGGEFIHLQVSFSALQAPKWAEIVTLQKQVFKNVLPWGENVLIFFFKLQKW